MTGRRQWSFPDFLPPASVRVIGCGRWFGGDDRVGLLIAEVIAAMGLPGTEVDTTEAPGAELFHGLREQDLLIVVDAALAREGLPSGTLQRIDYLADPHRLGGKCRTNTHTLSVDAALELARELGLLPASVWVYAVAVGQVELGGDVSQPVAECVTEVAARIRADIDAWLSGVEQAR